MAAQTHEKLIAHMERGLVREEEEEGDLDPGYVMLDHVPPFLRVPVVQVQMTVVL